MTVTPLRRMDWTSCRSSPRRAPARLDTVRQAATLTAMFGLPRTHERPRNVRLDTLIRLRWLAVFGQFAALLVVHLGLEFEVPIWACIAVITLAALLNVALRVSFHRTQWLEPDRAAWLLAF